MKIAICFAVFLVCYSKALPLEEKENKETSTNKYSEKFDNVNIGDIVTNDRLLMGYVNCLLEKAPCTPDGTELKKNLPDAINNDCAKCSEKQKEGSETIMHYLIDNKPDVWTELEKKYKSDGSYKEAYLKSKTEDEEDDSGETDGKSGEKDRQAESKES